MKQQTNFFKNCPKCNEIIYYTSKSTLTDSLKKKRQCMNCRTEQLKTLVGPLNVNYGKKLSEQHKKKISDHNKEYYKNNKNPATGNTYWVGRKHSNETKKQMSISQTGKIVSEETRKKLSIANTGQFVSEETRVKISIASAGRVGKKHKDSTKILISEKRLKSIKQNKHFCIGISGTYKGIHFRSLYELSYLIYLIKFKIKFECEPFSILYTNVNRYMPDFLIENKYLVEIKPKEFQNTEKNLLKTKAALQYCEENNLIYKIIDPSVCKKKIFKEYLNNTIIFDAGDKKRFLNKFKYNIIKLTSIEYFNSEINKL